MRVLTLIDAFRMGGAETLLAPLASACRSSDIEMEIVGLSPSVVNSNKTLALLREAGVEPRSLNVRRLLDPTAIPQLVRYIRSSRCDVVHAHLEMAISLGVPAATLAGRPAVCTFHHLARPLTGRDAKRERIAVAAAARSHRTIFVSEESRRTFAKIYGKALNWCVVNNGINLEAFAPGPADPTVRAQLGGKPGQPLVVLPGAFRPLKGIPIGVEAWALIRRRHPGAVLTLVGGGPLEDQLRRQVADLSLDASVVFAGVRTDMPEVYRAADLVLIPSNGGDNLPTTAIEASAAGRSIVASRSGGIPEIVRDGETGLLVDTDDPAALADAVCALLDDAPRRTALGSAAVTRSREHFSAEVWLGKLHEIYRQALGRRRRDRRGFRVGA